MFTEQIIFDGLLFKSLKLKIEQLFTVCPLPNCVGIAATQMGGQLPKCHTQQYIFLAPSVNILLFPFLLEQKIVTNSLTAVTSITLTANKLSVSFILQNLHTMDGHLLYGVLKQLLEGTSASQNRSHHKNDK